MARIWSGSRRHRSLSHKEMSEDKPEIEYLTIREVSIIVRRSPQTIYRWIDEGYLERCVKVKDGYLVPKSEITRILTPAT